LINKEEKKNVKRKFGKTCNGHWVSLPLLKVLVAQGFEEELAAEALKQSDNDEEKTYSLLVNNLDLLRVAIETSKPPYVPDEEQMQVIIGMGFTPSQAYGTLKITKGDMNAAVEKLLSGEGADEPIPPPTDIKPPDDVPELPDVP